MWSAPVVARDHVNFLPMPLCSVHHILTVCTLVVHWLSEQPWVQTPFSVVTSNHIWRWKNNDVKKSAKLNWNFFMCRKKILKFKTSNGVERNFWVISTKSRSRGYHGASGRDGTSCRKLYWRDGPVRSHS